jgi:hypothetical protein
MALLEVRMTLRNTRPWIVAVIRLAGLAIFALAFMQPGVAREGQTYVGWKCASVAASFEQNLFLKPGGHHESFEFLAALSGLINLLVPFTIVASPIRALLVLRRIFAVAIVGCMIATWALFAQQQISPLVGHVMWIAGALLVVVPDAFPGRRAIDASRV